MNIFVCPTEISLDAAILISVIFAGPVDGLVSTEAVADGVGLAFGDGVAGTGIPLFQIIFLPDLIAVYLLLRQSRIWPTRFGFSVGTCEDWAANTADPNNEKTVAKPVASIPLLFIELIEKS